MAPAPGVFDPGPNETPGVYQFCRADAAFSGQASMIRSLTIAPIFGRQAG